MFSPSPGRLAAPLGTPWSRPASTVPQVRPTAPELALSHPSPGPHQVLPGREGPGGRSWKGPVRRGHFSLGTNGDDCFALRAACFAFSGRGVSDPRGSALTSLRCRVLPGATGPAPPVPCLTPLPPRLPTEELPPPCPLRRATEPCWCGHTGASLMSARELSHQGGEPGPQELSSRRSLTARALHPHLLPACPVLGLQPGDPSLSLQGQHAAGRVVPPTPVPPTPVPPTLVPSSLL